MAEPFELLSLPDLCLGTIFELIDQNNPDNKLPDISPSMLLAVVRNRKVLSCSRSTLRQLNWISLHREQQWSELKFGRLTLESESQPCPRITCDWLEHFGAMRGYEGSHELVPSPQTSATANIPALPRGSCRCSVTTSVLFTGTCVARIWPWRSPSSRTSSERLDTRNL